LDVDESSVWQWLCKHGLGVRDYTGLSRNPIVSGRLEGIGRAADLFQDRTAELAEEAQKKVCQRNKW